MFKTFRFIIQISNFYTKQGSYRIGMLRTALRSARSPLSPRSVGKLPAAAFRNRHNVTNNPIRTFLVLSELLIRIPIVYFHLNLCD